MANVEGYNLINNLGEPGELMFSFYKEASEEERAVLDVLLKADRTAFEQARHSLERIIAVGLVASFLWDAPPAGSGNELGLCKVSGRELVLIEQLLLHAPVCTKALTAEGHVEMTFFFDNRWRVVATFTSEEDDPTQNLTLYEMLLQDQSMLVTE